MREEEPILLVEDRDDDVVLVRRSFQKAGIKNPIHAVSNGDEALAYLSGAGKYSDRTAHPIPQLMLLDLKMPKTDGFEVLKWIRAHPQLCGIRVVVLTSSEDIRDVNLAYSLGANSFLVKPADPDHFVELTDFISDIWFHWSKAPPPQAAGRGPVRDSQWEPRIDKVLLRDSKSRRFYAGYSAWVDERAAALDFERIELAAALAAAERLQQAEIILAYSEPNCELTLPVASPGGRA